eukprot:TRINITY_DN26156_c0_g1_i1.p1 TRINITY_DN26156_c0_g1~~TRINITY_DN26156_c0_g1_i1.p1  ORF type:complete len:242 (+),score=103.39 TRINITY_DN26156_c0_g1_i1:184-909(+)
MSTFLEAKEALTESLTELERRKATVQRSAGKVGTANDTPQLRERLRQAMAEAKESMTQASSDLRRLKRQAGKGTSEMDQASLMEQKVLQAIAGYKSISQEVTRQQQQAAASAARRDEDEDDAEEDEHLLGVDQTFIRRVEEVDRNRAIASQRQMEIEDIEQTVVEVHETFRAVQELVNDGTEQLELIETNVDRAAGNIEDGNRQLHRADTYGKRSRKLKCWLLFFSLIALGIIILWVSGKL